MLFDAELQNGLATRLHSKIKDLVIAKVYVAFQEDESLYVHIIKNGVDFEYFINDIPTRLNRGETLDGFAKAVVIAYRSFVLSTFFPKKEENKNE